MTQYGGSGMDRSATIRLLAAAEADLRRLDRSVARRVVERLRWLAKNAGELRHAPLSGDLKGLCKLRVGDWRVIYDWLAGEEVILIHAIGNRREIYQRVKKEKR